MKIAFRHRIKTACLLIGVMLFAQAALIAQACATADATPAMAFADAIAEHGCDEGAAAKPNRNACLQHCTAGDQTTAQVPAVMPAMPGVAVLTVPMAAENAVVIARAEAWQILSPGPSSSLRFCSFQL